MPLNKCAFRRPSRVLCHSRRLRTLSGCRRHHFRSWLSLCTVCPHRAQWGGAIYNYGGTPSDLRYINNYGGTMETYIYNDGGTMALYTSVFEHNAAGEVRLSPPLVCAVP